jgi:hypothetical protein
MTNEESKGAGRPTRENEAADTHIHLRSTKSRKGAYVKASRKAGTTLVEWCFTHLDKAAGYNPENPTPDEN